MLHALAWRSTTTIHSVYARAAYPRIVTLCQQKFQELTDTLLGYSVEAFPISVHLKKMRDGKRRCMEIVEAIGVESGQVKSRMLYRFSVRDNIRTEDRIKVVGQFEKTSELSDRLRETLLENSAPFAALKKFI